VETRGTDAIPKNFGKLGRTSRKNATGETGAQNQEKVGTNAGRKLLMTGTVSEEEEDSHMFGLDEGDPSQFIRNTKGTLKKEKGFNKGRDLESSFPVSLEKLGRTGALEITR